MKRLLAIIIFCGGVCCLLVGCKSSDNHPFAEPPETNTTESHVVSLINTNGQTIAERFDVPQGFVRQESEEKSFAHYLQNLSLKPDGTKVKYYDDREKSRDVYLAVVDFNLGERTCSSALMP